MPDRKKSRQGKLKVLLILVTVFLIMVGLIACRQSDSQTTRVNSAGQPASKQNSKGNERNNSMRLNINYPVETAVVKTQDIIYSITAVGSVAAFETVQVTAKVPGVAEKVLFSEGDRVAVGQVLAEIEPERYRLTVEAAQAAYSKALATKAEAEAGLNRRESVSRENPGLIPAEEIETWRTKLRLAEADVAQAKAALDQAELNLRDAYVRAPFSGIIQTRSVQTGQYIQVGMVLATLIRRDPLLLRFKVPEREAVRIKVGMTANFRVRDSDRTFTSRIIHVAASAEEESRMVEIVARINDTGDEALRPGAFAEITIPTSAPRPTPVISQTAIRPSERGFLAYVIENDKAVERVVDIGLRTADGQVEVLSGLQPGELLVVRGAEALRDGVNVKVVNNLEEMTQDKPSQNSPGGNQGG